MISRRHLHLLIALLLPLMVLRGMLPAGYMPVAENGALKMALCSDGLQLPGKDRDNHRLPGANGDCLFAHAVASAPPPSPAALPASGVTATLLAKEFPAAQQPPAVLPRAQSPRGPPALR